MTHDAEGSVRARIQRLPDASHVMCAVAELNELLQALADTRQQLDEAREANQIMREAVRRQRAEQHCGRSMNHPAHRWAIGRQVTQCPGTGAAAAQDRTAAVEVERDEARNIARRLAAAVTSEHYLVASELPGWAGFDALPDWLTDDPQSTAGPTRHGHDDNDQPTGTPDA